jgi:F-box-like
MASRQIASTLPSIAFDRIPVETWVQIAQALPANSLSSFVLSSRNFYKCANPQLYRTVYFLGTTKSNQEVAHDVANFEIRTSVSIEPSRGCPTLTIAHQSLT